MCDQFFAVVYSDAQFYRSYDSRAMSGAGQKRRFGDEQAMSALPPKADIGVERPVWSWPKATTTEVGSSHVPHALLRFTAATSPASGSRPYCPAITSCPPALCLDLAQFFRPDTLRNALNSGL